MKKNRKVGAKSKVLVPILIFLLSFVLRALWVGRYIGQDEIYYVGYTFDLIRGKSFQNVFPPFFEIFLSPYALIVGENEVAIHLFIAFLGAIDVLLVYWIGKKFLNEWVGVIAALLLTFNTTHWFFSDFGMLDLPMALFSTISLLFFWSGYKKRNYNHLILGSLFGCFAVLTKYGFFSTVAMFGYLILFDRKRLKDRRLLAAILIPLVVFGMWMYYYMTEMGWLWSWWKGYLTGHENINLPYYIYLESIYNEYLLPILTLFTLFTSLFLLAKSRVKIKEKYLKLIFLLVFAASFAYLSGKYLEPMTKTVIGAASLVFLGLNYWKNDFNRYLILIILVTFAFYSGIAVKFPRYVMSSLPAVYLLIGQMFYDIRKDRIYLLVALAVLLMFAFLNSVDTVNKLIADNQINTIKYAAQGYMIDNSKSCSTVYSKTWYGFYYLRDRVSGLDDVNSLKNSIGSKCSCPPEYIVSEGYLEPEFLEVAEKEKSFSGSSVKYVVDWSGIRTEDNPIADVDVYRIKEEIVKEVCKS